MRSDARLLDSAVFQLTPTRTRCELVITANGKSDKLASGLLNPFLAHLKTAQDQIAKGGYSIRLEPDPSINASWFTKGTLERFVRFVSTPEVLERVYTIEAEILQIEDAIIIQGNESLGLSTLYDPQTRSTGMIEGTRGSKHTFDVDAEKAIVLYKPGLNSNPPDSNGSAAQEENSKVQLLRVLETRKFVLQKEQGMAFARAAAAGFDMDRLEHLIMFAERFGASRLKEACLRFMELWKVKHETGQWIEVEAEAMSMCSGFPPFNASGIVLAEDTRNGGDLGMESIGNGARTDPSSDKRLPSDSLMPQGQHEHFQGPFQQPTFPPWAMHPPPVPPVYQPYSMHGMPYYPNYPGSGPFYQSAYPSSEDPRFNTHKRIGRRRHSMNSKDHDDSENCEEDVDQSLSEPEKEASHGHKSHKRGGRSGKKKLGVVVIKNINYVKSKKHEKTGGDLQSTSDADTEDETEDSHSDAVDRKHKKSSRSMNDGRKKSPGSTYDGDEMVYGNDADSGNWQAFQSVLLRAEEKMETTVDGDMFAGEKEPTIKRRQNLSEAEPVLTPERDSDNIHEARILEFDTVNGKGSRIRKVASNDELITSSEGRTLREGHLDAQFLEMEGGVGGYRRGASDDFMIYGQGNQINSTISSFPLAEEGYVRPSNLGKSSYVATDESFIVPVRSSSLSQLETESRPAIDMDLEFPSSLQRKEDSSNNGDYQLSYEPDDLTMMPYRVTESECIGYDPVDYDMEIPVHVAVKQGTGDEVDVSTSTKEELKNSEKKKLKPQDAIEKRRKDALMRRGISSKSSPLTEAQKRAEKLRAYKVDLQKAKKANEEEERKRLEGLKIERQKRIAARSSSNATQSPLAKETKAGLPVKASPSSFKGSKFSEVKSGSSSPLQKLTTRRSSIGSNDSQKTTGEGRSMGSSNGLTKSVPSLLEAKKANNGIIPEAGATAAHTKRCSETSAGNTQHASQKSVATDQFPKQNIANGPQVKISSIVQVGKTHSDAVQKKSVTKETLQQESGSNTTKAYGSFQENRTNEKTPRVSISDDNPVIEKNVVMLKNEMITAPALQSSGLTGTSDDAKEKAGPSSEYAAIRAPPSPIIMGEVADPNQHKPDSYEVVNDSKKDKPQYFSKSVTENYYQAPYARATSLEDPDASDIKYSEAPSVQSEIISTRTETAHVSDFSDSNLIEQNNESVEKPRSKESKGFRKLLKFGRKSHN